MALLRFNLFLMLSDLLIEALLHVFVDLGHLRDHLTRLLMVAVHLLVHIRRVVTDEVDAGLGGIATFLLTNKLSF